MTLVFIHIFKTKVIGNSEFFFWILINKIESGNQFWKEDNMKRKRQTMAGTSVEDTAQVFLEDPKNWQNYQWIWRLFVKTQIISEISSSFCVPSQKIWTLRIPPCNVLRQDKILLSHWTLFQPKFGLKYLRILSKMSYSNPFRLFAKTGSKSLVRREQAWLSKQTMAIPKTSSLKFKIFWTDFQIWKIWLSNPRFFGLQKSLQFCLLTSMEIRNL